MTETPIWNDKQVSVILRATELALEQLDRLNRVLARYPDDPTKGVDFYKDRFEIGISNDIARLLAGAHFETDCGHDNCRNSPINPRNIK